MSYQCGVDGMIGVGQVIVARVNRNLELADCACKFE